MRDAKPFPGNIIDLPKTVLSDEVIGNNSGLTECCEAREHGDAVGGAFG